LKLIRLTALWLLLAQTAGAQSASGRIAFEPYSLRTYDGQVHPIELGKLIVLESRAKAGGATVAVAFLRLKSTSAKPGAPIVFLMGGPGIPATVMASIPPYWELFDALRASGDVILLDQRGLGMSAPKLDCPPLKEPLDTTLLTSQAALVSAYAKVVAACAAHWREAGVDPRAYSDVAIADDIDDIRAALGVPRVSVLGFSYGTRLAMAFARRRPDRLERLVLQGPTDVDLEYHISLQHDSLFSRIAGFAAADTATTAFSRDLVARMRTIFDRASNQPVLVKIRRTSGDSVVIPVGREGLRGLIEGHLADPRLPAFVATTEHGDLTILTRWVEGMYNDFGGGAGTLMARAVTCSFTPSAARRAMVDPLGSQSIFGPSFDNFASDPAFCSALGGTAAVPQSHARGPIAAPVLFITGELDDRTPVGNDAVLAREFSNSIRLVVTNGGHELLPDPGVRAVVVDFFAGRDVRGRVLKGDPPRFLSIEAAKLPPRRRGQ
jgi:pimeloyl-ACP methyl ester carboxylesterase